MGNNTFLWWGKQPKEYNYDEITKFMFWNWHKHSDAIRMRQLVPHRKGLGEYVVIPSNIKIHYDR